MLEGAGLFSCLYFQILIQNFAVHTVILSEADRSEVLLLRQKLNQNQNDPMLPPELGNLFLKAANGGSRYEFHFSDFHSGEGSFWFECDISQLILWCSCFQKINSSFSVKFLCFPILFLLSLLYNKQHSQESKFSYYTVSSDAPP